MDATALARSLLDPVPAHRTAGLEVLRAEDGIGVVAVQVTPEATNVIGSLHSGGLITLIDAAGLAAIISSCPSFDGVVPLGAAARLRFRAPARGRLVATCTLDPVVLGPLFTGDQDRVRFTTAAAVTDDTGTIVCDGEFDWSVRRALGSAGDMGLG